MAVQRSKGMLSFTCGGVALGESRDRAIGEIVRKPSGESVLYFHTDRLGNVSTLSTDTGDSYHRDYDVWGAPLFSQNDELTRAGFTGHQHDADLGLIDMKGRIYDPLAGRFMTPDPIMQAPFWNQGLNRYSYVFNDPVNNTDPSGWSSVGDRFSTAWNATGAGLSSAFVDTKNDEGLGMAVMGWGAAAVGGAAGGASGSLGVGSISATVNNPRFGGGFAGSSATASLYSSSAMSRGLEQRLAEAPDQRLAYGPESLLDPNSAFPDTQWGRAARDAYYESYLVTGASLVGEAVLGKALGAVRAWWAARAGAAAARGVPTGMTRFYRAVGPAEFEQLMSTGKFAAGPNSLAGKFFAETAEHAAIWGEKMMGAGNFRIITADVPTGAAAQFMRWARLDGIGPAVYAELEQLSGAIVGAF